MRIRRRTLRRLSLFLSVVVFLLLAPVSAAAALSQNLLVNPGFDGSSAGWTIETKADPNPERVDTMSLAWTAMDASGSAASGSLGLHVRVGYHVAAEVWARQCREVPEGRTVSFGGKFRTARKYGGAGAAVETAFFASLDCSGATLGSGTTFVGTPFFSPETNSNGLWSPVSASTLSPPGTRSMRVSVHGFAAGFSVYGQAWVDAEADDVYAVVEPSPAASWVLPSAAKLSGAAGSVWTTGVTLANPDADDALVTLKFLGHDGDGSSGPEKTVFVRAGTLVEYPDVLGTLFVRPQDYGAIRITSSSVNVVVQSETSTPVPSGGTVGQALPAFGPADFAGASPKTLAPIRENAEFRTNLVLANATEIPVTAHVELFTTDGATIGSRDVALPPLGMTQLSRVASALGAASLDLGRISVSTPTPGGLVAAHASVIDNVTNDPRTLLPQDATPPANGPNLLTNPGFDRDLSGWALTLSGPEGHRSGAWDAKDANGDVRSGSAYLTAGDDPGGQNHEISAVLRQCVSVVPGRIYGLHAQVSWSSGGIFSIRPYPRLRFLFHRNDNCTGESLGDFTDVLYGLANPGSWLVEPTRSSIAPSLARSASIELSAGAAPFGGVGAYFDDVVFSEGPSIWTPVVPSAAAISGLGASFWTTTLTLANPTSALATAYLYGPANNLEGGRLLSIPNVVQTGCGCSERWFPLFPLTTSPAIAITAETSTPVPGGGTVGQALAAFGPRDFAGATPKAIAPIRDNDAFRTNLVLVNVTSAPLVVHLDLFDAAGASIGSLDVPLDGSTQIGAVGSTLSGAGLDVGRISVSTPTPDGLVAAYASVIDNVTNDPRTILPR